MANHADRQRQVIEDGDIEEAMNAAAKIGDNACRNNHRAMGYRISLPTVHLRNG
jgi:predicted metalloprotease